MLKQIYTLFVGILLATFIGVGISTFYEGPKPPEFSIEETIPVKTPETTTTLTAEEIKIQREQSIKREDAYRNYQKQNQIYSRNVSVIASISAVILLIVSLTLLKNLDLLSDGLLLGGVFTQLYSVIRGFESEDSKFRFLVITIGLAASLAIGYFRFVRPWNKKPQKNNPRAK